MNKRLSNREKVLLFVGGLLLVVFVYWYWLYNPLLQSIDKTRVNIKSTQERLLQIKNSGGAQGGESSIINIYQREKQFSHILTFIDQTFNHYHIDLLSLRQSADATKLIIDIKIKSNYYQFLGFLNALLAFDTIVVIDSASVALDKGSLVTEMRLLSGYR